MTREEAIKIIKEFINETCLHLVDQEALKTLIPELVESEDERIRKAIKCYVEDMPDTYGFAHGIGKKEMLAYLEKQKENIEKEYVFRPLAGTDITIAAEQAIRRANEGDRLVLAFNGAYIPVRKGCNVNKIVDIYDAFIEKQKEQKQPLSERFRPDFPDVADFIDSVDDMEKNRAIGILEDYLKWAVSSEEECRYTWKELADAIQLGIDAMKEQKQEWSEKEFGMLFDIEHYLNGTLQLTPDRKIKCISFLKALRPQSKKEWSEEEKRKLNRIYSIIGWAMDEHAFSSCKKLLGDKEGVELQDFLRSIVKPKQEWSEEDERNYEYLHQVICCYINNPQIEYKEREKASKKLIPFWERLKSLPERFNLQSKQEWNEDDEHRRKDAIYFLESAKRHYADTSEIEKTIDWLKSLRLQQKNNKDISPKEGDIVVNKYGEISVFENWGHHPDGGSFNDKTYFFAKCTLDGDYYDDCDCYSDSDGLRYATPEEIRKIVPYLLKSISPQSQKLEDWTEENKEMFNTIVKYHFDQGEISPKHSKWAAFLKSLRPQSHWKPSEEQMEALKDEIKYCYACGMHERGRKLQSLYDNLYKLM